eukprot:6508865-Pyramimonas_sp.AAC.1
MKTTTGWRDATRGSRLPSISSWINWTHGAGWRSPGCRRPRGGRPLTAAEVIDLCQSGGRREPSRSRGRSRSRGDDEDDDADEPRRVEARCRRGSAA